jgi:hypothetical protein
MDGIFYDLNVDIHKMGRSKDTISKAFRIKVLHKTLTYVTLYS